MYHLKKKINRVIVTRFCKDVNCKVDHYNSDIDAYYTSICDTLLVASRKHIPSSNFRCSQDYVVPAFNEHLTDLNDKVRQAIPCNLERCW